VYKETLQGNGSYVRTTVDSGLVAPVGLAIDSAGNVYVGLDYAPSPGALVKETLQGDGSYVRSYIGSGSDDVYGVAVDSSGNVYADDNSCSCVHKFIPNGDGGYTSHTIFTAPDNEFLAGLALDSPGDVFVAWDTSTPSTS